MRRRLFAAVAVLISVCSLEMAVLWTSVPASKPPKPTEIAQAASTTTPRPFPPTQTPTAPPIAIADQGILPYTPSPPIIAINGIALDAFVVMPEAVRDNIRRIFANGQILGNNSRAFSKLGDSTIEHPYFLENFDGGTYDLGSYIYLQPVIAHYSGSFGRASVAVQRGLHTWSVFDPMWSDPAQCRGGENMLDCELRLNNPSVIFIRVGSNDVGLPDRTDESLRRIVETCLAAGVIPILGTKADRFEGRDDTNNQIIREIAAEYLIPLWDFDLLAGTLPGRGLTADGVHLTGLYPLDYTQPEALESGYGVHTLTALMALDQVWREVTEGE